MPASRQPPTRVRARIASSSSHRSIALGVRNITDNDPQYTNAGGQNYFQSGYDPGYVDPRGRFF